MTKALFTVGLIVLVLGIASLFVPFPHRETHAIRAGDVNLGVQTRTEEKVSPVISAVLIGGGIVLMLAGSRRS